MKKELSFLLLFIFIFSSLAVGYLAFSFYFLGSEKDKKYIIKLENRLKNLDVVFNKKRESHQSTGQRNLASIPQKEIQLDAIYIENLRNLKKADSITEIKLKNLSQKILKTSPTSEVLAETYYLMAEINCKRLKNEESCLGQIEVLVDKFPSSAWTGRGLFLLSQLYLKMNRASEAQAVLKIIKAEFPKDQELVGMVKSIENTQL